MTVSTQNIPNSKIKTATYNNTEIYMYGPVDIRDTNNSKTTNNTNNKRNNIHHATIYNNKTRNHLKNDNTKIPILENKYKLVRNRYKSNVNRHISKIQSRINQNLKNNKQKKKERYRTQIHRTQKSTVDKTQQPPQLKKRPIHSIEEIPNAVINI